MDTLKEKTRILIVEDEAIIAMDLSQRLEIFGYAVTGIAASGDQALRLCYDTRPDLVMMDIVIRGDKDGIETAALIRGRHDIPVVYLTAYSDLSTLQRARETLPYGYLVKPFRPDDARATIEVALVKHRMERQLRQNERWFAKTLHCVSDGVVATNEHGALRLLNSVARQLLGVDEEAVLGAPIGSVLRLVDEHTQQAIDEPAQTVLATRMALTQNSTALVIAADGRETVVEYNAAPILDNDNALLGAVIVLRDISHRRKVERALAESEERFHSAFDFAAIGMALVALDGRFLQLNDAACAIFGLSPGAARCVTLQSVCHHDDCEHLNNQIYDLLTGGAPSFQTEIRFVHPDSQITWAMQSVSLVSDGGAPLYFIVQVQDITARRSAEAQLVYLSQFDHLTGLHNRTHLTRMLEKSLAMSRQHGLGVAVMFIDLDNFKLVNDTLGHAAGDALLKEAARRLRTAVRESDMVGRIGGDEFVIVLTGIDKAETAQRVASNLLQAMERPAQIGEEEVWLTISIGVSLFPNDASTAERLLAAADNAMYRAKELGKNGCAFFSAEWSEQATGRILLETNIRRALAGEQFELHYQPIYTTSGKLHAVEALVRWRDPKLGLVYPGEFIPTAENSGLIVPLGQWVLDAACKQLRTWHDGGAPDLYMAVNLSGRQFRDPKLLYIVEATIAESGINPKRLELELTESAIMQQPEKASSTLRDLCNMGLRISVDDFGTGYSSLNYLKRFPIHNLKIDRSFISGLPGDRENAAIVSAIITMSHALGLRVIAEGVETQAQLDWLREQACDLIQGHFFSQASDPLDLAPLLAAGEHRAST
ncbi:MAG TPA: EAL domain-containing protein [Accumulibacter sp.]|uniref:two-component system response regulator n=2 Tax=Accumulibacter sp. TaxID=2053492 RepID=UPI002BFC5862|nr:EAL domain-containing protein [Accumulibacter sp.]HMV04713.1 EAL domain-containing protein [Accumulibacter sp.]HMW79458.1 EAL domain-containing protein [Accumulibacter sp.]HNC25948.1 EAL domain-containing protein [Accumulibacter sp.]HND37940.1 EAL domain-containing protein [Accumulibacter sp.]HNE38784.1 EAL domain-containing protein [Accumulibacter sp.]